MQLSILIPSFNGKTLLQAQLPPLLQTLQELFLEATSEYEVIVIDNGSTDETVGWLTSDLPTVRVVALTVNTGFTGAINAGADAANGNLLFFLNNDCKISTQSLRLLLDQLAGNPKLSAVQPIIRSPAGVIENIGFVIDFRVGKAVPVTDPNSPWINHIERFKETNRYLYGLSATALLIRKQDFIAVGRLDARFHSYLEDIDLAIRMAKADKKYVPVLTAEAIHQHLTTSKKIIGFKEKRDLLNWIRIIMKHYTLGMYLLYLPFLVLERARNLYGLVKRMVK